MGFSLNSGEQVAEPHLDGLTTVQGIGLVALQFSVRWRFEADARGRGGRIHSTFGMAHVSFGSSGQGRNLLGHAWPESTWTGERLEIARDVPLIYRTLLTTEQFIVLERSRLGRDVEFSIEMHGMTQGIVDTQQHDFRGHHTVRKLFKAQEWIEILQGASLTSVLFVEMTVDCKDEQLGATLRKAQQHFLNNETRLCVGECRMVIDGLFKKFDLKGVIDAVLNRERDTKTGKDKRSLYERTVFAADAMKQIAHLAVHPGDDGRTQEYSRAQAQLVLSGTMSLADAISKEQAPVV